MVTVYSLPHLPTDWPGLHLAPLKQLPRFQQFYMVMLHPAITASASHRGIGHCPVQFVAGQQYCPWYVSCLVCVMPYRQAYTHVIGNLYMMLLQMQWPGTVLEAYCPRLAASVWWRTAALLTATQHLRTSKSKFGEFFLLTASCVELTHKA